MGWRRRGEQERRARDERRARRRAEATGGPSTARQRLEAAEARLETLTRHLEQATTEIRSLIQEHHAQATTGLETLRAESKDDYRRQVGVLDVVRREQKRLVETTAERLTALEQTLEGLPNDVNERIGRVERTLSELPGGLDERLAATEQRIDALADRLSAESALSDGFRTESVSLTERLTAQSASLAESLSALSERVGVLADAQHSIRESIEQALGAAHSALEQLVVLAATAESANAASSEARADAAGVQERMLMHQQRTDRLEDQAAQVGNTIDRLHQQVAALGAALGHLGPLPERVGVIDTELIALHDRLAATELLLNQREDLELQFERAEEFERVLAEVDPANYATRDDLLALRTELTTAREIDHSE